MQPDTPPGPPPPKLYGTLNTSSDVCHLSGTPPFSFIIELSLTPPPSSTTTSSAAVSTTNQQPTTPITLSLPSTPFSDRITDQHGLAQHVAIASVDTGEPVELEHAFLCFDSDPYPGFPRDEEFVEMGEGLPALRLEVVVDKEEMWGLGKGEEDGGRERRFEARLAEDVRRGFSLWRWGRKEEVLAGSEKERRERWKGLWGRVEVAEVGGPVVFRVVE